MYSSVKHQYHIAGKDSVIMYMMYGVMKWPYALDSISGRRAVTWWRHQMETFSALLAICSGNSPVPGVFPVRRPVTRSFDVFFDLISGWVNNHKAGDLRRYRAHYDVIVMQSAAIIVWVLCGKQFPLIPPLLSRHVVPPWWELSHTWSKQSVITSRAMYLVSPG